jgi:hypothetical protein
MDPDLLAEKKANRLTKVQVEMAKMLIDDMHPL